MIQWKWVIITTNVVNEKELLQIAASAEKGSEHPLGEAIVKKGEEEKIEFYKQRDYQSDNIFRR